MNPANRAQPDTRLNQQARIPAPDRSESNGPLLTIRGLRTYLPARTGMLNRHKRWCRAVDGVDLDVSAGRTFGLVGESGCGKTTLARTLLGLTPATAGTIRFDGIDVLSATGKRLTSLRRNMQMVFQDPLGSLNPRITVGRSIEEPLFIHRVGTRQQRRRRVAALLEQVGMPLEYAGRYPHELSGGQCQRVNIARAIALEPKLVVCDEPVSALDVSVQAHVLNLLEELKARLQLTMLFISHDLAVVRSFCDVVAVMYLGKIVEVADASELFEHPKHPYTMALRAAAPRPDPSAVRQRRVLAGDVPTPIDPPSGCAFHPRCPFTTGECRAKTPALRVLPGTSGTHVVACHLAEEDLSW